MRRSYVCGTAAFALIVLSGCVTTGEGEPSADAQPKQAELAKAKLEPAERASLLAKANAFLDTGALEEALDNVTYFYARDVAESVSRLQALIMPAITMVLGVILFWIMASILGPIYDLFTQIDF